MSQTERNIGKLVPVKKINGESNEEYAHRTLEGKKDEYNKTFLDQLLDDGYEDYVLHNDILYSVVVQRDLDGGDIYEAKRNSDGSVDFILQYYNGGCSFSEAIETALNRSK